MAEIVKVELVDDIDQSPADEKILFSVGTSAYQIDLSKANADKFQKALKPFVDAARPAGRVNAPARATARRGTRTPEDYPREAVRTWAKSNGMDVGDRGRIKGDVVSAWKEAGSPGA